MGLDMYLERFPLVRGTVGGRKRTLTPQNFNAVDSWVDYQEYLKKPLREDETEKSTWEKWCGNESEYLPDEETLKELAPYLQVRYWSWDTDHKYPHTMISEQVGYWRKANSIHNWFVETIQNGEDDCHYHRPITACDLEDLRDTCQEVLDSLELEKGMVANGYSIDADGRHYNFEEGLVATDTTLAEELLPTQSGFFFGGTDYDEYYAEDLKHTIEICEDVLATTDFNKQQIFYCSSW